MDSVLFYLCIVTLIFFISFGLEFVIGNRSIIFLKDAQLSKKTVTPKVSIIIPARNEERGIETALNSILSQDYDNLEIIAVNDRSTDRTGEILNRMEQLHSALRVIHVAELPNGWVGKNYALNYGAEQSNGKFLLFTDADVVMSPITVGKAVNYMVENQLDHITLAPETVMPNTLLQMFVGTFTMFFFFFTKPWKVKRNNSRYFVGIGAFNFIRAKAYHAIGGHQAIAMRPDDDVKLGKLIKKHGYRQELLFGKGMVFVEWYASLRELITGLAKSMFSGVDYKISVAVGITLLLILFNFWPFVGVFLTSGKTQFINLVIVAAIFGLWCETVRFSEMKRWHFVGFPVTILLFIYIQWRATLSAFFYNGIFWRGTHYRLNDLKANKV